MPLANTVSPNETFPQWFSQIHLYSISQAIIFLIAGLILSYWCSQTINKYLLKRTTAHTAMLARRGIYYGVLTLFIMAALQHLGFSLSIFLGAAGIVTVAVGFASQTSVSNLISGLFLITEKPFQIGDVICIDKITGEVLSIDALSIKIRLFDNTLARIPNETLIKSNIINQSRFPIRRFDLQMGVAYKEDMDEVKKILLKVADQNPLCLDEPIPKIYFIGFGDSAINLQFSVWSTQENFNDMKNQLQEEIKKAFEEHDIEMPFPGRAFYVGSETSPLPITLINSSSLSSGDSRKDNVPKRKEE